MTSGQPGGATPSEHLLLTAALRSLHAGYLNQPCQVPDLRRRVADVIGHTSPQLVVRIGTPSKRARPAPRRPVAAVVDRQPPATLPIDEENEG